MRLTSRTTAALLALTSLGLEACKGCRDDGLTASDPPVEEPDVPPNDVGQYLSMDVIGDQPVISYYDRTKGALAFAVGTIDGDSVKWAEERIDGYANEEGLDVGDRGKYTSLVVDADQTAWITYYDATNGNLFYARRDAPDSWTTGVADTGGGSTPNAGLFGSLALDAAGNPVVAHYDENKGNLRVARWDGDGFTGEIVDEGEAYVAADTAVDDESSDGNVGKYARMLVAADGTEYIAYYDAAYGDLKLATGGQGSWEITTVASDGDVGAWPSMLMDNGQLLIAFQDVENQDLLLARGLADNWEISTIDDGEFIGADSELYMNGSYPAVVYFDGRENDLRQASFDGSLWSPVVVDGAEAGLGFHNETVLIGATRYAGCYDYTNRTIWFSAL